MAGLGYSNISSSLIRPNVMGGTVDLVFRGTDFINFLRDNGAVIQSPGSEPFKWNLITASNVTTEVFAEFSAPPVAGRQSYAQASLSPFYVRAVVAQSGRVRDSVARGGTYEDVIALELAKATADLMSKVEDELLSSTQDRGLASIVDANDTYAGISPTSVTNWASEENNVGGALTIAAIEDLYEELVSGVVGGVSRGAKPTHILMPPNQVTNWIRTIGPSATTSLMRFAPPTESGQPFDPGLLRFGLSWNGLPIVSVAKMAPTEIYMLDMSSGIELVVHRDITVDRLAKTNDDDMFQVSFACALKVVKRNAHGKLTGVTA